ncbi:MAG: aminotransferase V [Pseudonocardiales bacterium]|nr:MAG: aminotransferase V [Pseudonocardiales bacterium]
MTASQPPLGTTTLTERLAAARAEFDAEVTYLNSATLGLPPRRSWDALQAALSDWRVGTADAMNYDPSLAAARAAYARLVGVPASAVAAGSQVSAFVGLVAANLPDRSQVLTATGDFTSILFPFYAQARRGVCVRAVPLERIAEHVTPGTTLVSVSAVQSADGRLADLDALRAACAATATPILLDLTQAAGWLPVDAGQYAYTVCAGYKWLLTMRGTAYFTVGPELMDGLIPHTAGWYAGAERWSSIYGGPLRLAPDARRFDLSPAWHSWVAASPAVGMLADLGSDALHAHAVSLSDRFCAGVEVAPRASAIVSLAVDDDAAPALDAARIKASMRAGRLRLSFHVSTSEQDVDHAVDVLRRHVLPD